MSTVCVEVPTNSVLGCVQEGVGHRSPLLSVSQQKRLALHTTDALECKLELSAAACLTKAQLGEIIFTQSGPEDMPAPCHTRWEPAKLGSCSPWSFSVFVDP